MPILLFFKTVFTILVPCYLTCNFYTEIKILTGIMLSLYPPGELLPTAW